MELLIIIVAILAVLVIGGRPTLLLRPRRRGPGALPRQPEAPAPGPVGRAGQTDEAAAGVDVLPPVAEPSAPDLERPPPLAGRLVRLRGRLARSQAGVGAVVLGLVFPGALRAPGWG